MTEQQKRDAQRVRSRKSYLANKVRNNARSKAWREAHPERMREIGRASELRNKERIKEVKAASKIRRLEVRAGRAAPTSCEVCGGAPTRRRRNGSAPSACRLDFDHDHVTGAFRGWLCSRCNRTLGMVNDDIDLLEELITYLMRSRRPKLVKRSI
jgi:hypothetical protein